MCSAQISCLKWACICARKELRFNQDECVVRNPGCCFLDESPCCSWLGFAEVQLSHNLAVNPARPPATTDDGISFDKAAGLKRFRSHSYQLHTFSHNAGWEGGLLKITRSIVLDQNGNNRNLHARPRPSHPPKTMQVCASHTSALCSSPQSCSESRPPTRNNR